MMRSATTETMRQMTDDHLAVLRRMVVFPCMRQRIGLVTTELEESLQAELEVQLAREAAAEAAAEPAEPEEPAEEPADL